MSRRDRQFVLNRRSPLAGGLVSAALGAHAGTTLYRDSALLGRDGTLSGFTGAGNAPKDRWAWDETLGRFVLGFNGSADYVPVTLPSLAGHRSAACWLKSTATAATTFLGAYNASTPYNGWGLALNLNATGNFGFWNGYSWNNSTSATGYNSGAWCHAVATFDGSNIHFFKNGVADGSPAAASPSTFAGPHAIGATSAGSSAFPGTLADVMIWSRAISGAELAPLSDPANVDLHVDNIPLLLPTRRFWPVAFGASASGGAVTFGFAATSGSDALASPITTAAPPNRTVAFAVNSGSDSLASAFTVAAAAGRTVGFASTAGGDALSSTITAIAPMFSTYTIRAVVSASSGYPDPSRARVVPQ